MKKYLFIIKSGTSTKIGRKTYSKEDGLKRQAELKEKGIIVSLVSEDEAFGVA